MGCGGGVEERRDNVQNYLEFNRSVYHVRLSSKYKHIFSELKYIVAKRHTFMRTTV